MRIFGEVLYFFGAIISVFINGVLYLLSSIWVFVVWVFSEFINLINHNKITFILTIVLCSLSLIYFTAQLAGSYQ